VVGPLSRRAAPVHNLRVERHVDRIRTQFTRQAEIYARMRQTTDQRGLDGLVQLAAALPRDRVLDVACGPGFLTMAFAARAEQVTGFDATEALLDLARAEASRRGLGNVTFASGDAEQLPYADESFDVVACRAALHDRMERLCDPTHVRALPQSELVRLFDSARLDVRHTARGELGITVDEWIAHGGPDDETERELRALAAASVDGDRAGLGMHRDTAGRLAFAHRTAAFLLVRPA
jgi:SAM-dependent methyltransferase